MNFWMWTGLICVAVSNLFNCVSDDAQDKKIEKLESELADLKTYLEQLEKDVDDELEDLNSFVVDETSRNTGAIAVLNEKFGGLKITWEERKKA